MKVAIITRSAYRSPRFLSEGLSHMLNQIGIDHDIYFNGIEQLELVNTRGAGLTIAARSVLAKLQLKSWSKYDLFIVSDTVGILAQEQVINRLRQFKKPVLLYEVFYPGGAKYWLNRLPANCLDLFDGYLTVSPINDIAPTDTKPVYPIGINLAHRRLDIKPDGVFTALMDFPRTGYEAERALQLAVLKELKIKTIILDGEYSFDEISHIYDQANIYFVAFPEAFGVPIAQLQNNGCYIASPETDWVKRHAKNQTCSFTDNYDKNQFSSNFLFYDSYQELLESVDVLKQTYRAEDVQECFSREQPSFKYGDTTILSNALKELVV